jgi:hypothetical protein
MLAIRSSEGVTEAGPSAGELRGATTRVIRIIGNGLLIAVAGSAIALGGAAAAGAQPGLVDAQSGSQVDADGTQGSMVPAVAGEQRVLTTQWTDGHEITSDACHLRPHKGCLPPASFNPGTISAATGVSDDPDSALDPDGYQTNKS